MNQPLDTNIKPKTSPVLSNKTKPFEYLKNIQNNRGDSIQVIKGCIVTLSTKLGFKQGKTWNLSVIVTDGSETKEIEICSQFLENEIGIHPKDYPKLSAAEKIKVKESVQNLSKKLESFNGLIKLKSDKIIDLVQVNRGHLQQLKNRLKD